MSNSEKDWTVPALPTGGKAVNLGYLRADRVLALYVAYPFDMDKFKFMHSKALTFSGGAVFMFGMCLCEAFRYTGTTRYICHERWCGKVVYDDIASKLDIILEQVDCVSYIAWGDALLESFAAAAGIKDASDITQFELRKLVEQIVLHVHDSSWRSYAIHEFVKYRHIRTLFSRTMATVASFVKQTHITKDVRAKFDELVWIDDLCSRDDVNGLRALRNKLRATEDVVASKQLEAWRKEGFDKVLSDLAHYDSLPIFSDEEIAELVKDEHLLK